MQTLSRNKQQSTLDGHYIYIRIYIHIHLHVHMSAQVSLIVMRIRVLNYIEYISVEAHHGEQGHEPQ